MTPVLVRAPGKYKLDMGLMAGTVMRRSMLWGGHRTCGAGSSDAVHHLYSEMGLAPDLDFKQPYPSREDPVEADPTRMCELPVGLSEVDLGRI